MLSKVHLKFVKQMSKWSNLSLKWGATGEPRDLFSLVQGATDSNRAPDYYE